MRARCVLPKSLFEAASGVNVVLNETPSSLFVMYQSHGPLHSYACNSDSKALSYRTKSVGNGSKLTALIDTTFMVRRCLTYYMTPNNSNIAPGKPKIDRVIDTWGLEGLGDELVERWLGTGTTEQSSTRDLADYFNKEVLRRAIRESDTFTLGTDVDEMYRSLADGENADATLVRSRLEQSGIDVETVTDDFISHQTVYRYLKEHRGVKRPQRTPKDRLGDAVDMVQQLQGRTIAVTEQKVQTLKNSDLVSVGEFSVVNDVQVICESCGRSHDVTSFFNTGGCECEGD